GYTQPGGGEFALACVAGGVWAHAAAQPPRTTTQSNLWYMALLLFSSRPPCLHQLLLPSRRHGLVMAEVHRVGAFATGQRFESRLIVRELRERHERRYAREPVRARVVAADAGAFRREVAGDIADRPGGSCDLDAHDRLEHDRIRLLQSIEKCLPSRRDERHFLRIDRMALAVVYRDTHVLDGKSRDRPLGKDLAHTLLDRRDELARNGSAHHIVDELEPGASLERLDAQIHLAELAGTASLLLVPAVPLGWTHDRLPVGDARRMGLHVHAVAFGHALEQHSQVKVTHPVKHRIIERRMTLDAHARVFG